MSTAIIVNDFSFKYNDAKKITLKKLSFTVEKGEFVCIVGPNGAGKSTICSALVGLVPSYFPGQNRGEILVNGIDTKSVSVAQLARHIGFVFQNPFNQISYTTDTVEEELAYGLTNLGVERSEMKKRVHEIAKLMRVEHLMDRSPLALSGGQVQRVAIGSALVMEPDIIVLDECTTQLDPLGSEEIFDIVMDLNKNRGITVVMVDHDMERIACSADKVIAMAESEIVQIGTPEEIFGNLSLTKYSIDRPSFTDIGVGLKEHNLYNGPALITEEQAIEVCKGVM